MGEYQRIGNVVPFGETFVGPDEVMPIRELAEIDLFLCARTAQLEAGGRVDRTKYSLLFETNDSEFDGTSQHISVLTTQDRELDTWRLIISHRRYRMSQRHDTRFTYYRFDGFGEQVLQAKKQVYVLLGGAEIVFDENNEPQEVVNSYRRMYEKALQPDDCINLADLLARGVKRARAA